MRSSVTRLVLYASPFLLAALGAVFYFSLPSRDSAATQSGSVQVAGSETMRAVMTACAEDFMTRHPQSDIVVKGGGSGDGIAALLHGMIDIGMTSRELSQRERDYAQSKGIDVAISELALDGITIVVNRANPIAALDLAQLRDIFAGNVGNWKEFESRDTDIVPIARAPGSGTASLFDERVMDGKTYGASVQRQPTNEAIVADVAARPGAIGYTSLGAARSAGDRVKVIALQTKAQAAPVMPSPDAIRSGQYPLTRALYLGTAGKPASTTKTFLDFCLGASAQPLLQRAGYVGIARAQ